MKSLPTLTLFVAWTSASAFRTTAFAPTRCRVRTPIMVASEHTPTLPETGPLPTHTFAGMVEQGLLEKLGGPEGIERILTSWRLLDKGYEHREFVGGSHLSPETSQCHQHCHSYVPGLSIQEFWDVNDPKLNAWTIKLQKKYKEIKEEFTRVALDDPDQLQQQGNNIWAGALTEDASSYGMEWKTLVLCDRGVWDPVNVNLFPKTAKAIYDCGVPVTEVFFAKSGNNKCRLTIGDETRQWINGELMVFDTSLVHDAVNDSDEMRYILMMRVWHPDLTPREVEALKFTFDCLNVPDLVSTDPAQRSVAERQVEAMRTFPAIRLSAASVQGFGGAGNKKEAKKKAKSKK